MDSYLFQENWSEMKEKMWLILLSVTRLTIKNCFLPKTKVLKSQIIPSCASLPFLITAVIARFTGLTALNQIMRAKFLWRHESHCIFSRNRFLSLPTNFLSRFSFIILSLSTICLCLIYDGQIMWREWRTLVF